MSKARLFQAVKAPDLEKVKALLEADPALRQVTDERRRNALHLLCGLPANEKTRARSLGAGFDVNAPAFVEGAFQATPPC
jgi:hypothetical protein